MSVTIPTYVSVILMAISIAIPAAVAIGFYFTAHQADVTNCERITASVGVAVFLALWVGSAWILASQGFFHQRTAGPPNVALAAIPLIGGYVLTLFPVPRKIIATAPNHWLIAVQVYRIGGILFLILYALRLLPGEFALPAGIGDIAVGIAAPFVAYLSYRGHRWARPAVVIWNIFGLADLVNAVTLGVLSAPSPLQRLAFDAPYDVIPLFPVVLVPTVVVPLSIILHVLSLRSEFRSNQSTALISERHQATA